jgi:hypothetical protein
MMGSSDGECKSFLPRDGSRITGFKGKISRASGLITSMEFETGEWPPAECMHLI